ncbi:CLUMA_CG018270, isoform A [Clunio marinus]|uniref:CLUMA_CG018270, isoform A n=1 Tax=Clunio marinus TaxID=568069 RepID=A0A1J1IXY9_9DIPT|nr:CLUMA_CG018270, isoform A [Clunio marinus]
MSSPSLQGSASLREMEEILKRRKQNDDQTLVSTNMSANNSDLLNCFMPGANVFSPQFLANQTAAAVALMTWPIQLRAQLASAIRLPNHSNLFGSWPPLPTSLGSHEMTNKVNKTAKQNKVQCVNDSQIVSTTSDLLPQRKTAKRKQQPETIKRLNPLKVHTEQLSPVPKNLLSPSDTATEITTAFSNTAKDPTKDKLKAHMLIHNGEKPFGCGHCQSKFRRRHHLMSHKCGTPNALSPAESPLTFDHKSNCSEMSDESLDLNKAREGFEKCQQLLGNMQSLSKSRLPVNSNNNSAKINLLDVLKQNQSQKLRNFSHFFGLPVVVPEQTEPEDLSLHSPRSRVSTDDLDDIDDASVMYLKSHQLNDYNDNERSKTVQ